MALLFRDLPETKTEDPIAEEWPWVSSGMRLACSDQWDAKTCYALTEALRLTREWAHTASRCLASGIGDSCSCGCPVPKVDEVTAWECRDMWFNCEHIKTKRFEQLLLEQWLLAGLNNSFWKLSRLFSAMSTDICMDCNFFLALL